MVELILGKEGKGKSRVLLDYADREVKTANGNLVFLDKDSKHMYELNSRIRLIDISRYNVKSSDEFIGFLLGLLSQDNDLEQILIDGFLTIAHLDQNNFAPYVTRMEEISQKFGVKFVVSICWDEPDIPAGVEAHIMKAL